MENLANIVTSKVLVSKLDNRFATLITVENEEVILDIEGIGKRTFSLDLVKKGFVAIMENKELIKNFLKEVSSLVDH